MTVTLLKRVNEMGSCVRGYKTRLCITLLECTKQVELIDPSVQNNNQSYLLVKASQNIPLKKHDKLLFWKSTATNFTGHYQNTVT